MKKVIIHIGRHKTGTSSLQSFFLHNRKKLFSDDIYYPKSGCHQGAHHGIGKILKNNDVDNPIILSLLKEIYGCRSNTILLSSESFQNVSPEIVQRVFGEFDTHIIIYLRSQIDYVASSYAQFIQSKFSIFTLDNYIHGPFRKCLDYNSFVCDWEESFPNKVLVSLYNKKNMLNENIIDDFCHKHLKIKKSYDRYKKKSSRLNYSLDQEKIAFKLYLNQFIKKGVEFDPFIYFVLESFVIRDNKSKSFKIPKSYALDIVNEFEASNTKLEKSHLNNCHFQLDTNNLPEKEFDITEDKFIQILRRSIRNSYYFSRFLRKKTFIFKQFPKLQSSLSFHDISAGIYGDIRSIIRFLWR